MIIDISDILSCENKEETKQVQIELTSFISKLGEFPIISAAPIELRMHLKYPAVPCLTPNSALYFRHKRP